MMFTTSRIQNLTSQHTAAAGSEAVAVAVAAAAGCTAPCLDPRSSWRNCRQQSKSAEFGCTKAVGKMLGIADIRFHFVGQAPLLGQSRRLLIENQYPD